MNRLDRRGLLRAGTAASLGAAVRAASIPVRVGADEVLITASGAGVNLKVMPDESGNPIVPMRESFAFDPIYAQCIVEATDGGVGGQAPPDSFAFTVYFDADEAPVNHGIFGPEFTFTGEMIVGKITIGPPIGLTVADAAP